MMESNWEQFVIDNGWRAKNRDLSVILNQSIKDIESIRATGAVKKLPKSKDFSELFSLWNGRLPTDDEWPTPVKYGKRGTYEWQQPEIALLISLVGQFGIKDIVETLSARLKKITGDVTAERSINSVQLYINRVGLQSKDVLGGITTSDAGREIGSLAIVNQAIQKQQLSARRVGRLWVISHESWKQWKSKRVFPPPGYVLLSSIKDELSIKSDKLSEFAKFGYVPSAVRCNPYGTKGPSTQFGTWYIDKKVADQLLSDRRAGRPMPWHGKPLKDNLRVTFKLWQSRIHPETCSTCIHIWGEEGAPKSFEDYMKRYPELAFGAKRHLTRPWTPGLTLSELADKSKCSIHTITTAISTGMLETTTENGLQYISKTDATRWIARKCPTGENEKSWLSLESAQKNYMFTAQELDRFIKRGELHSKIGTDGPMRGVIYVSKHQCAKLREKHGFSETEAAKRVGVSIPKLRMLLDGVQWRKADGIPLATVQAAIKRLNSKEGYTLDEAAEILGTTLQWVIDRKMDGTIKVLKSKWDGRRVYITDPTLQRLKQVLENPVKKVKFNSNWLRLSEAADEAGVTNGTLMKWANNNEIQRKMASNGWRYHREAVRARARKYWQSVRFHRATPPEWLVAENAAAA